MVMVEMIGGVLIVEMLGGVVMARLLSPMAQAHSLGMVVDMVGRGVLPGTTQTGGAAAQIGIRRMIVTLRLTIGTEAAIGIGRAIVNGIDGIESESEGMVDIIRKVGRLPGFAAYAHPSPFAATLFFSAYFRCWTYMVLIAPTARCIDRGRTAVALTLTRPRLRRRFFLGVFFGVGHIWSSSLLLQDV